MKLIEQARKDQLKKSLESLGNWALNRSKGDHDELTTFVLLDRKVEKLKNQVNKAGWLAREKGGKIDTHLVIKL